MRFFSFILVYLIIPTGLTVLSSPLLGKGRMLHVCEDSTKENFSFDLQNNGRIKSCNDCCITDKKKQKFCTRKIRDLKSKTSKKGYLWCPDTCLDCKPPPCIDDKNFRFKNFLGDAKIKCEDLMSMSTQIKTKTCNLSYKSQPVKDVCLKSCDNCRTAVSSLSPSLAPSSTELGVNTTEFFEVRKKIQDKYGFNNTESRQCQSSSNDHQKCLYEVMRTGRGFECECRPTSRAKIYREVDMNNNDEVTLQELQEYFDNKTCVFPFKYTFEGVETEYNECTTVDDAFNFPWCPVKLNLDRTHPEGFWKYCDKENNAAVFKDALDRLDTNGDGSLSFTEAVTNARLQTQVQSESSCNDCITEIPDYCKNPVVNAMNSECRNFIKTIPLNDDELLRILADAMNDVYCGDGVETGSGVVEDRGSYEQCALMRGTNIGDQWLKQIKFHEYNKEESGDIPKLLGCAVLAASGGLTLAAKVWSGLKSVFGSEVDASFCDILDTITDGRDAIQWAKYEILRGEHKGKTILAYMGTDLLNVEQVLADIYSVPLATSLIDNMADDAVNVAIAENPDYITGHSLGGLIAEMVCTDTGIEGASFAALGAVDPFSLSEQSFGESLETSVKDARRALRSRGYNENDINTIMDSINPSNEFAKFEYNGLITGTQHNKKKFEVVMNKYDIPARALASADGSHCSHISSSCDMRWLWFDRDSITGGNGDIVAFFGHSSNRYSYYTSTEFTTGWELESKKRGNPDLYHLPGLMKNYACDLCTENEMCQDSYCFTDLQQCSGVNDKMPTLCDSKSSSADGKKDVHASCRADSYCHSGRCEFRGVDSCFFSFDCSWGVCYEKEDNGNL